MFGSLKKSLFHILVSPEQTIFQAKEKLALKSSLWGHSPLRNLSYLHDLRCNSSFWGSRKFQQGRGRDWVEAQLNADISSCYTTSIQYLDRPLANHFQQQTHPTLGTGRTETVWEELLRHVPKARLWSLVFLSEELVDAETSSSSAVGQQQALN